MTSVVGVIGPSKSGKTTLIERVVSKLSKEGLKIGTVKHIHHTGFSFDVEGKDSWRHSQAGAKIVVCVAPDETVMIRKGSPPAGLDGVLDLFKDENLDLLFIEGFHSLTAKRRGIHKIVTAKSEEDLRKTLEGTVGPILAITGPIAQNRSSLSEVGIPIINLDSDGDEILNLIRGILKSR